MWFIKNAPNVFKEQVFKRVLEMGTHCLRNYLPAVKDKMDKLNKSGVYKIECGDCQNLYIG